jgi:hypothetical protein
MQGVIAFVGLITLATLVTFVALPASFLYAIPVFIVIAAIVWAVIVGARPAIEREAASEEHDEEDDNAPIGVRASSQR